MLPADFAYEADFLAPDKAAAAFAGLQAETPWRSFAFRIFGRTMPMPRRIAWYGETSYRYSGLEHPAAPMPPRVAALRDRVQQQLGLPFNTVLLNLYRDGRDAMGWHHDADYDDGGQPCIASLSLGATRRFLLRAREGGQRAQIDLGPGSLLCMGPEAQRRWRHAVPRTAKPVGARINLTFRHMRS